MFDVSIGGAMLLLAFIGIAASDVSSGRTQTYWLVLAVAFGLLSILLDWVHEPPGTAWAAPMLLTAVHWLGVLAAIELVHVFIDAGRLSNANIGLLNGVIVALGTFSGGVRTNWRLMVIGAALGLGTAAVAYVEQYLWILFALAVLALAAIYLVARWRGRHSGRAAL